MAFNNPASKMERALVAFLMIQGKADPNQIFTANDSRVRALPNRTIQVESFHPQNPHRPEGICSIQIVHHFAAALQPGESDQARRVGMDKFLGDTMDSLVCGDNDSLNVIADGITAAGRWLAQKDNTPAGDQIAKDNADMVNFRCDWIKLGNPLITRGNAKADHETFWAEIIHIQAFVSNATN